MICQCRVVHYSSRVGPCAPKLVLLLWSDRGHCGRIDMMYVFLPRNAQRPHNLPLPPRGRLYRTTVESFPFDRLLGIPSLLSIALHTAIPPVEIQHGIIIRLIVVMLCSKRSTTHTLYGKFSVGAGFPSLWNECYVPVINTSYQYHLSVPVIRYNRSSNEWIQWNNQECMNFIRWMSSFN